MCIFSFILYIQLLYSYTQLYASYLYSYLFKFIFKFIFIFKIMFIYIFFFTLYVHSCIIIKNYIQINTFRVNTNSTTNSITNNILLLLFLLLLLLLLMLITTIETRKHLDIEGHWTSPTRPELLLHSSHPGYEAHFQQLLEQYPCPEDYNADTDVAYKDDPVVKEL